jgi:hypothetical protein
MALADYDAGIEMGASRLATKNSRRNFFSGFVGVARNGLVEHFAKFG